MNICLPGHVTILLASFYKCRFVSYVYSIFEVQNTALSLLLELCPELRRYFVLLA